MKRNVWRITLIAAAVLVLAGAAYWLLRPARFYETPLSKHTPGSSQTAKIPAFDHIVILMLENKGYGTIIGNRTDAPYLNSLASQYALAANDTALFHPSLPNYIALTGGTNAGITSDCSPGPRCQANTTPITAEIDASHRSWKTYLEDMPAPCTLQNAGRYAVRHNPFVYYPAITNRTAYCAAHDVPYGALASDLAAHRLPNYVFIAPNICDDMHSCPVSTGDAWLQREVPKLLDSDAFTKQRSLLVITFDEAEGSDRQNVVPLILVGSDVKRGYVSKQPYTHYSLVHTIEQSWQLDPLTASDKQAPTLSDFFSPK